MGGLGGCLFSCPLGGSGRWGGDAAQRWGGRGGYRILTAWEVETKLRRSDVDLCGVAAVRGCLVGIGLAAILYALLGLLIVGLLVIAERVWGVRLRW